MEGARACEIDRLRAAIGVLEAAGARDASSQPSGAQRGVQGELGARDEQAPTFGTEREEGELAFAKLARLVAQRDHATAELRAKLRRAGFSEQASERALERAVSCGLVDDRRFAEAYVHSKLARGKGEAGIKTGLEQLGIDPLSLNGWSERFRNADELDRALAVLEKSPPRSKNLRDAAYRKLLSRGFSSPIAASAARRWAEGRESFSEE